ncbi:transcriptional regulator [Aurantimonas sp. A2-1-M11]|uniref:transcriptional regulator n=1 Tax=Aurantimonas sp. A2-1-M11 TaxID=3113712 RepID=UPI002F921DE7
MLLSIAIGQSLLRPRPARSGRRLLAALLAWTLVAPIASPAAAELLVLERPGCIWCARFDAEIAPAYPRTDAGRKAPLRRVDVTEPWPHDLTDVTPERITPSFVLVENGQEIARLRGYPGEDFFWGLVDDMLKQLPAATTASPVPIRSSD